MRCKIAKLLGVYFRHDFYSAPQCSHCKRCTSYGNSDRISVRPSVRLSVCLSVTRRYCVKTTARSTVQFALSDSKMCLDLEKPTNIPQGRPLPPEILAQSDLPSPDSSEPWHVLPCSASTVRASEKVQLWRIGSRTQAFQRAINQGSTPPLTSSKWDQIPNFVVFETISTIKDEKSAAKFHYIKTVSNKVVAQSIAFRVV